MASLEWIEAQFGAGSSPTVLRLHDHHQAAPGESITVARQVSAHNSADDGAGGGRQNAPVALTASVAADGAGHRTDGLGRGAIPVAVGVALWLRVIAWRLLVTRSRLVVDGAIAVYDPVTVDDLRRSLIDDFRLRIHFLHDDSFHPVAVPRLAVTFVVPVVRERAGAKQRRGDQGRNPVAVHHLLLGDGVVCGTSAL